MEDEAKNVPYAFGGKGRENEKNNFQKNFTRTTNTPRLFCFVFALAKNSRLKAFIFTRKSSLYPLPKFGSPENNKP